VREERAQVLAKLNRDYASSENKLELRQAEQAELGRVLKRIEEEIARRAREEEEARQRALAEERRLREQLERQQREQERALASAPRQKTPKPQPLTLVSSGAGYGGPFAEARGRLPWPISGRLIARYGSPRGEDNRATWDGVLISASAGSPVRAIHDGRVVFADWLRGSGLLVILDHGNGYLSLYGHNQSLLKNAGDIVKAGEPIATVGTSGGQETPALYFAIRQQGRPTDPAQWCRAQG
jgi:septal ring factor EnvC (AmiA/AmiB activator)